MDEVATVLAPMGLRLSVEKTKVTHIYTGVDFLGVAHPAPPDQRSWREDSALHLSLTEVVGIHQGQSAPTDPPGIPSNARPPAPPAEPEVAGCAYFQQSLVKHIFAHIDHYAFWRIVSWLTKRHPKLNMIPFGADGPFTAACCPRSSVTM